ncbi:AAA family ATPase [Corynebacterium freiburgense]|uniref:AAA family ATPase n=1 Tax=Corynebacterium freiburgense TaxID=556548 RepID=UPI000427FD10|nr:ATP-binding protein [Corynebacterium freiburgense]WJZ01840.1 hypothetical protein CFREI_02680 [Corynebacterium freiburgense]
MLLSVTLENYRSFAEEVTLDLQRRTFSTLRPRSGERWQDLVLPRAAIFGPNAAGKSNMIAPLGYLKVAVLSSLRNPDAVKKLYDPHRLKKTSETVFDVEYVADDIRFRWVLVLDKEGVVTETLEANEKRSWRRVFHRSRDAIIFNKNIDISKAVQDNISEFLTPWALTLSAWLTVKTPGRFVGGARWWSDSLLPIVTCNDDDRILRHEWVVDIASKHGDWMKLLKLALVTADVGVSDVRVVEEKLPERIKSVHFILNRDDGGVELLEDPSKLEIKDLEQYMKYVEFSHGQGDDAFSLGELDESQGTRVWMDIAIPAYWALYRGSVLVIDEIDSSLHPALVRALVGYFGEPSVNTRGAQLIFSSHDMTLLGKHPVEALDREEVWLVEKRGATSTLVALDEFSLREPHNIEKRYFQGAFGAVPIMSESGLRMALESMRQGSDEVSGSESESSAAQTT